MISSLHRQGHVAERSPSILPALPMVVKILTAVAGLRLSCFPRQSLYSGRPELQQLNSRAVLFRDLVQFALNPAVQAHSGLVADGIALALDR